MTSWFCLREPVRLKAGLYLRVLRSHLFGFKPFCLEKRLRHRNVARTWKKVEHISTFFNRYVRSRQWNCFIFLSTNSVEALLEEGRSQHAQVETGLKLLSISITYLVSFGLITHARKWSFEWSFQGPSRLQWFLQLAAGAIAITISLLRVGI